MQGEPDRSALRPTVLIVSPFEERGAVEDYAWILAEGLPAHGFRPMLLAPPHNASWRAPADGVEVRSHDPSVFASVTLAAELRRARPDLVHLVHPFAWGLASARALRCPVVVTSHTPGAPPERTSRRGRTLVGWGRGRPDRWIVLSEQNRTLLRERDGIAPDRIRVVPPGLPVSRFPPRESGLRGSSARANGVVVGVVARLSAQKRHDVLIDAVSSLLREGERLHLTIAGRGELEGAVRSAADALPNGAVTFLGHREDIPGVLASFDIFALASDYEGLPFAILEAMAMGLPIVATDIPGTREAIHHAREGLLVPPRDPPAMADAIRRLVHDPPLASRLGAAARERFHASFTDGAMIGATASIYREVIEHARRG